MSAAQVDDGPKLLNEAEVAAITPKVAAHIRYRDNLIVELQRSLTASGDALKRYGWHGGGEPMCERVKGSSYPCTCGLDAILAKGETK